VEKKKSGNYLNTKTKKRKKEEEQKKKKLAGEKERFGLGPLR